MLYASCTTVWINNLNLKHWQIFCLVLPYFFDLENFTNVTVSTVDHKEIFLDSNEILVTILAVKAVKIT
jgi:hypothetical protein